MGISLALCALALLTQNSAHKQHTQQESERLAASDGCDVVIVDEFVSGQWCQCRTSAASGTPAQH